MYGYSAMFGAPNNWRLDADGKLVKDLETEEFKATIGWMRDTWAAGLWYPDSLQLSDSRERMGSCLANSSPTIEGFGNSWNDFWRRGLQLNPPRHFGFITPFRAKAGDPPQAFLTGGFISTNVMKQASPDRIQRAAAHPGLAGRAVRHARRTCCSATDFRARTTRWTPTVSRKPTPAGTSNAGYVPWRYLSQHPYVQYQADLPGYAESVVRRRASVQVNAGDLTRCWRTTRRRNTRRVRWRR